MDCNNGNLNHQGVWKSKIKCFPKIKPSLPVGKKNWKKELVTNPEQLKDLYLDTFKYRLRKRPVRPGFEEILDLQEKLFNLRLELAKSNKSTPWTMKDLEKALKKLKSGKCRDPEGLVREIFKEEVIGDNLKESLLFLFNRITESGKIPPFMRTANMCAIYKGKDGDHVLRKSLRSLIEVLEPEKRHIFIVNSIIHDVLSKKSNDPIDIMVLD